MSTIILYPILWVGLVGCADKIDKVKEDVYVWKSLEVTATAYNSLSSQTDKQPNIAAWGDTLKPGMKCIAISRDLLALGLKHNTMIKIDTFAGIYLVKDKMNRRWRNRIDIYMGESRKRARQWGRKKINIQYAIKKDSTLMETHTP
ncbi:MAG: hypothetical protein WBG90_13870 [Saonia sp.]